jgi:hypothetical protein
MLIASEETSAMYGLQEDIITSIVGRRHDRGPAARRSRCLECSNSARKRARHGGSPKKKEHALKLARQWKRDNRSRNTATKRRWEALNPDKTVSHSRRSSRKWRSNNRELGIQRTLASKGNKPEYYKTYQRDYQQRTAAKCRSKYKAYMARKCGAMPIWADGFLIQQFYDVCTDHNRLRTGGMTWAVDHIVPLNSKLVCGLHVHDNLRVIPHLSNISKGNRFWPDMP